MASTITDQMLKRMGRGTDIGRLERAIASVAQRLDCTTGEVTVYYRSYVWQEYDRTRPYGSFKLEGRGSAWVWATMDHQGRQLHWTETETETGVHWSGRYERDSGYGGSTYVLADEGRGGQRTRRGDRGLSLEQLQELWKMFGSELEEERPAELRARPA